MPSSLIFKAVIYTLTRLLDYKLPSESESFISAFIKFLMSTFCVRTIEAVTYSLLAGLLTKDTLSLIYCVL